ncbi:MAG: DUF3443 family protein [Burkholderiaceae bacterium]|jgi:hypothetical protein|nr:MAG: DUF3443 family protein [Burkholderiaceae bacterium]
MTSRLPRTAERSANHSGAARAGRCVRWIAGALLACALAACGDGGGTSSGGAAPPPAGPAAVAGDPNAVPIYVDGGPPGLSAPIPNAVYATVRVCTPGSNLCANIDHVLVDTGSVGLRLLASALNAANPALIGSLPQASASAGAVVGECLPFVSGVAWGGVRSADLHWGGTNFGGSAALGIAIQVIGDPDARLASIPSSCSNQGSLQQSVSALGANGILGVGLFAQDCGSFCAQQPASNVYYQCAGTGSGACTPITMPTAQQVPNPVAAMAVDNNGTMIRLPGGAAKQATGLLVLGIGTRANNGLVAGSAQLATDARGYFSSVFNGNTLSDSFIDSGSSANFMPTSGNLSLPDCTGTLAGSGYLCPPTTITLVASNSGAAGTSANANVLVVNAERAVAANPGGYVIPGLAADGGSVGGNSLDLGASFFFGRTIATLIENQSAPGFSTIGPAFGYTP